MPRGLQSAPQASITRVFVFSKEGASLFPLRNQAAEMDSPFSPSAQPIL